MRATARVTERFATSFVCLFYFCLLTENYLGAPQCPRRIRAEWYQDELASLDLLLLAGVWSALSESYGFES
jgi:hypothetical protein